MLTPTLLTTLLLTLFPALAHTANLDLTSPSKLEGSCTTGPWPTESSYRTGLTTFCTTNFPNPSGRLITNKTPLTSTLPLTTHDNKPVSWTYQVLCEQTNDSPLSAYCTITSDECKLRFGNVIDENFAGGMGRAYCVVDGTGGDFFGGKGDRSATVGEGVVLVQGGRIDYVDIGLARELSRRPIFKTFRAS